VIPHRQSQKLKRSHYWGIGDHLKSIGDDITGGAKDIAHDVEEVADDVADKVSGTANLTGNATSDINAGTPDKKTTIFNDKFVNSFHLHCSVTKNVSQYPSEA